MKTMTINTQLEMVKENPITIRHFENPCEEVCLAAVRRKGNVIRFIENPSEEVCMMAIRQCTDAISYIKNIDCITYDMCLLAVSESGDNIRHIIDMRPDLVTEELCIEAVKNNGMALSHITNPSYDVCLEAVKEFYLMIVSVPRELVDEAMILASITKNKFTIKKVVILYPELITEEICMKAVSLNYRALKYIPEQFKTEKLMSILPNNIGELV